MEKEVITRKLVLSPSNFKLLWTSSSTGKTRQNHPEKDNSEWSHFQKLQNFENFKLDFPEFLCLNTGAIVAKGFTGTQGSYLICTVSSLQLLSCVQLFATPWTTACQPSLSIVNSLNLLKLMSIESVMPCNHLILCRPLLLLPSIFPSFRVLSNESVLCIRWSE